MTLLITLMAAIIATIIWYKDAASGKNRMLGTLSLIYWGAGLMWLVDSVVEYLELGAEFFAPAAEDMLNDTYLGLSVVVLGLIIWLICFLVKDPDGVFKKILFRNSQPVK